ncbi:S1C family serine protease [uncultured Schumannella sp.]|uniref:S1C family serine protease n=1 Tax=uncultured Schumannella sp. TaxID=1195956 RepID=UPI0025EACDB6|nr:S1C family serine protease [uncultured Schumannella sp.]
MTARTFTKTGVSAAAPSRGRRSPARIRSRASRAVAFLAIPATLTLSSCLPISLGGTHDDGTVDFDGVQSATIQIEAVGTFVDPSEGGYEAAGRGSGFVIDESGIAVTNNHVVVGAGTLKVWLGGDTGTTLNAKVLGSSECLDLAVIDLQDAGYPYMGWRSDDISTAIDVYAAGFPLGDPTFTMTRGIVSKASTAGETPWASLDRVIEHDARIRGGNSGGPLVDQDGRVVGVNYAGNDQHDLNLAIHRDEVLSVIEQLAAGEDVLSLGINATALMGEDGVGLGVWVSSVKSGSAADQAGILPGDLLTRMEGVTLATDGTLGDYCDVLRTHGQDATLSVELYRPSEGIYYRGKVNDGSAVTAVTVLGNDGGTGGGAASGEYVSVVDDTQSMIVEVPASWNQSDGSVWTDGNGFRYAHIEASPNLAAYATSWDVPGVSMYASAEAYGKVTPKDLMKMMSDSLPAEGCELLESESYDDGWHSGGYTYWDACGGKAAALVVTADAPEGGYVIMVAIQSTTEADLAAIDRILGSFYAQF